MPTSLLDRDRLCEAAMHRVGWDDFGTDWSEGLDVLLASLRSLGLTKEEEGGRPARLAYSWMHGFARRGDLPTIRAYRARIMCVGHQHLKRVRFAGFTIISASSSSSRWKKE